MKTKTLKSLVCLLLLVVLGGEVILSAFCVPAEAWTTSYSNVLDDLKRDSDFSISDYPSMTLDYYKIISKDDDPKNDQLLAEIIQIAENSSGELYLYTYQPVEEINFVLTSVSISLGFSPDGQELNPKIYDLRLVSTEGVFSKYVVEDLKTPEEQYRYYNIVAVYRPYIESIDTIAGGSESSGYEKGISVGQQWCAYYQNDSLMYEMSFFNTVELEITFTGNIEYSSGLHFGDLFGSFDKGCLWFVTFNVENYVVEKVIDADLSYKIRDLTRYVGLPSSKDIYGTWSDDIDVYLDKDKSHFYDGGGLFAKKYSWDEIMTTETFRSYLDDQKVYYSSEVSDALDKSNFVFAFLQTEMKETIAEYGTYTYTHDLEKVTVIRLKFMDISGKTYNLGAVSDRVNPDNISDGYGGSLNFAFDEFGDWLKIIVALIGVVILFLLLSYLSPVLKFILDAFILFFRIIFRFVFWILSLLFNLFKSTKK